MTDVYTPPVLTTDWRYAGASGTAAGAERTQSRDSNRAPARSGFNFSGRTRDLDQGTGGRDREVRAPREDRPPPGRADRAPVRVGNDFDDRRGPDRESSGEDRRSDRRGDREDDGRERGGETRGERSYGNVYEERARAREERGVTKEPKVPDWTETDWDSMITEAPTAAVAEATEDQKGGSARVLSAGVDASIVKGMYRDYEGTVRFWRLILLELYSLSKVEFKR